MKLIRRTMISGCGYDRTCPEAWPAVISYFTFVH
jgi:hypothetical protein